MKVDTVVPRTRRRRQVQQETRGKVLVTASLYGQEKQMEEIYVQRFEVDPAYVRVNAGVTRNLGNYESLRLDVSITVPCYVEKIQETFDAVSTRVAALLESEIEKYEQGE
jgi:hypothetical protein